MADKIELQHTPRAVDALVHSEARSSLIARARKDAFILMESKPATTEASSARLSERSAVADHIDSAEQFRLGQICYSKQAYPNAAFWFYKAAEQGHLKAICHLGIIYAKGQGVSQNYAQAVAYLRKAAEQGDVTSIFNLVILYVSEVMGIPESHIEGYFWATIGAIIEPEQAGYVEIRNALAAKLRAGELLDVQTRVNQWHASNRQ